LVNLTENKMTKHLYAVHKKWPSSKLVLKSSGFNMGTFL